MHQFGVSGAGPGSQSVGHGSSLLFPKGARWQGNERCVVVPIPPREMQVVLKFVPKGISG